MSPTHDLKRALQSAAESGRPAVDPADDLARAVAAARARSRRRFRVGLAGVASVAVLGVGAAVVLDREPTDPAVSAPRPSGVELVSKQLDATPYTFDLTPKGWSVQAQNPTGVTIVPDDGSTSDDPDVFVGKLVIMFDANPPDGRVLHHDGRRFWVAGTSGRTTLAARLSGYTTVATHTRDDEPAGVVRIQYPNGAGWDEPSMVAFLASVHVGPGARHGLG
ncbi:hypothetical protein [Nocardioides conyzicola]|uniref:Uncharacterized protein n=1 Tax=Nocardioides conyzicola TaxID=1651781 RepID=A0ABP8WLE7_9ACTN